MGIAAVAGAVGSIGSSFIQADAAKSAASTQAASARYAADLQMSQFQQNKAGLQPFVWAGNEGVNQLSWLANDPTYQLQALQQTPGYQFALDQGLKATQSGYAARGLGTSGAALKGAAQYATGLAQQTYQQNVLAPAQFRATLGENAAAQTGSLGAGAAANAGAGYIGAGNASAAGTIGAANAYGSALNTLGQSPLNYSLYKNLLGSGGGGGGSGDGSIAANPNGAGYGTYSGGDIGNYY